MTKTFAVYQVIDLPAIKKLRQCCQIELTDSDIELLSQSQDLGEHLYLLNPASLKAMSTHNTFPAMILSLDTRGTYVVDLQEEVGCGM